MSAITNDTNDEKKDGVNNDDNNKVDGGVSTDLNPSSMANEISTLSMKMAMNTIENNKSEVKEGNYNNNNNNEDEVTMNTYHDLGRLTLESIPKRFKLYELLVKDHPTSAGKNASTSERLQTNDQRSTLVYGEISFNSFGYIGVNVSLDKKSIICVSVNLCSLILKPFFDFILLLLS